MKKLTAFILASLFCFMATAQQQKRTLPPYKDMSVKLESDGCGMHIKGDTIILSIPADIEYVKIESRVYRILPGGVMSHMSSVPPKNPIQKPKSKNR